ncbi:MAG: hypothetical protein GPOALKHO_000121 [Sodalis sp.]|nr:MAG: hypothetical protein GPOALKHO_000121 [Sodalis sp.]
MGGGRYGAGRTRPPAHLRHPADVVVGLAGRRAHDGFLLAALTDAHNNKGPAAVHRVKPSLTSANAPPNGALSGPNERSGCVDINAIKRLTGVKTTLCRAGSISLSWDWARGEDRRCHASPAAECAGRVPAIGSTHHGAAQTRDRVKTCYATPVSGVLRQLANVFIPSRRYCISALLTLVLSLDRSTCLRVRTSAAI